MAALANISLKNAADVEEVYTPSGVNGNVASWHRATDQMAGRRLVSLGWKLASPTDIQAKNKTTARIEIPILDAAGLVKHVMYANCEFSVSQLATDAERDLLVTAAADYVADAVVRSAVQSGDMPY